MRHLLSAADLDRTQITEIFDVAEEMSLVQGRPVKKLPALRGRTVVNLFFEDSTRTRSSFEIAGKWLSADVINISAKGSSVSKGESLRDTVLTVAAMGVDALVIRHHASGAPWQASHWIDAHVLNAGDGTHEHPTQALLDGFTIRRHLRRSAPDLVNFEGKTVAIVGDITHSRVARSNVLLLSTLGAYAAAAGSRQLAGSCLYRFGRGATACRHRDDVASAAGTYVRRVLPHSSGVHHRLRPDTSQAGGDEARCGDLPSGTDEPRLGNLRGRSRRGQLIDLGPGCGRSVGTDERAV
jgi:aspartate carbamoyltransferase catalytic subunit